MSLGDLIAVLVAAVAAAFSGLSWWSSRRSAGAAERSATASETSSQQSVVSADAAQRSASAAEENLEYARADREAQRVAARTPRFRMGPIDWRGPALAASAVVYMPYAEPKVERVEISVPGAAELGTVGHRVRGAPSVTWERPVPGEVYTITFLRQNVAVPATLQLDATLTADDDAAVRELVLLAEEGAESSPR